jgi:ribose transport system ATP-binding protein
VLRVPRKGRLMEKTIRDLLSIEQVSKSFPGVRALDFVSFQVIAGEVHGLVGENGAGKSTLMAVASGTLTPDAGSVTIAGQTMRGDPELARQLGLAIVRQEPSLMPDLTVAENMLLGVPAGARPSVADARAWAAGALKSWNSATTIDPGDRINSLNPEQRFIVEIAKALAARPKVLILDEPTEHLMSDDIERLFKKISEVTEQGAAVVYISHRIREVRKIANRITVLRDGKSQGSYATDSLDERRIVELIVGGAVEHEFPRKAGNLQERGSVLAIAGFGGEGFRDVDLSVRHGEIIGLGGIDGNGQREFVRALAGLVKSEGQVLVGERPISLRDQQAAKAGGIGYLPGDRHREGIFAELSVRENFSVRSIEQCVRVGFVDERLEIQRTIVAIDQFDVRTPTIETPVSSLSGGNQQKLLLSSLLAAKPAVLLVDEPTQGVDVGARAEIYRLLRATADAGTPIIIVSSDGAEIAGLCDRVLVFSRGLIVKELEERDVNEINIAEAILTSTGMRHRRTGRSSSFLNWASGQVAPLVLISAVILATGIFASLYNEFYLTGRDIKGLLALTATLALVAYGQQFAIMIGGIDLSVGPLMGLVVVVGSFFLTAQSSWSDNLIGLLLMAGTALAIGLLNFVLIEVARLHFMVVTLATFIAVQALSLTLRPQPGGPIDYAILDTIGISIGFVPVVLLVAVAIGIALEYALLRTTRGIALRGFGSRPEAARAAGVTPRSTRLAVYLLCSLFAGIAAIPFLTQVGIGDPTAGPSYTLASIAAVVVGGGSITGGRGSFLGALLGALLLNQAYVVAAFLQVSDAWNFYLQGAMVLVGVAVYSKSRKLVAA